MGNYKFVFAVISAAGNSGFNYGFQGSILNIIPSVVIDWYTQIRIDRKLNLVGFYDTEVFAPFILACFSLGGIFGSLLVFICAQFIGRKNSIICSNFIILMGLLLQSLAYVTESYEVFIIGRFLTGLSAGLLSGVAPMYLVEISPYCVRGTVGSVYYVMVAAATALANILGLHQVLGYYNTWPWLYVCCLLPSCLQIVTMSLCPESPRYLLIDKEDDDEAEEALAWLRDDEDIDHEMNELREEAAMLKDINRVTFARLFKDQTLRSPMIITTVILMGQQLCGVETMLHFSVFVFHMMGYNLGEAIDLSIGLACANLALAIICMIIVDKVGRKILLMGSLGGIIMSSAVLSLTVLLRSSSEGVEDIIHLCSFFVYLFVAMFALGAGPIPWFYAAELNNQLARPMVMTIGLTLNWLIQFVVIMTFLPLQVSVDNYVFMIYFGFDIAVIVFVVLTMRETMNLESIDIAELFY
ncbi:solute carrier family 2, facilitated glucose transporter member 3-like [Zophobas morio]|uniref:solute carrier family 2, facilitated glucose transporter member 3-like n=1 Tax=Zophobas morio TaxID=2755281 RepID=UPI0030830219